MLQERLTPSAGCTPCFMMCLQKNGEIHESCPLDPGALGATLAAPAGTSS